MSDQYNSLFSKAEYQDNPLRALTEFLSAEKKNEDSGNYEDLRFVGYVLEIGYQNAKIITSDPFKKAVGGVPRGSFLIMCPDNLEGVPPHFSLLRVSDTAPTPLSKDVQQTYFELHKKSMPELDKWTLSELQWGALSAEILGMFYPDPENIEKISYSGDVNNVVSAHRYKVFAPNEELLNIIVNGTIKQEDQFKIGELRFTECKLPFANTQIPNIEVSVSTKDFRGFRTAMFGKTRLGKSNVVKIIAQSIIETTDESKEVGQLIFDINGEYANDNPQDGNKSLSSSYPERCRVYALTERPNTPSKPLSLNFYEQPGTCMDILSSLIRGSNNNSNYVNSFASVSLSNIDSLNEMSPGSERTRAVRKIQIYWAILNKAGFSADESRLRELGLNGGSRHSPSHFNPGFNRDIINLIFDAPEDYSPPRSLNELRNLLERVQNYRHSNSGNRLTSSSGNDLFDANDEALLEFFSPATGSGPQIIRPYMEYHNPQAGDFVSEIIELLDEGFTVILDLGNATDKIRRYFSDLLSREVFVNQEKKFTSNQLGNKFVQLYFEEAHNLFPKDDSDFTDVYARFAKEGAKFHIGMVYSTQSPSTINRELLAQTENFFVAHMSSQNETNALAKLQVQYEGLEQDILKTRTPGYMRIMTFSHRFIVPVQINKFEAVAPQASTGIEPAKPASNTQ